MTPTEPPTHDAGDPAADPLVRLSKEYDDARLAEETKNERYMWWYLAYFLFGIHLVAFVMILAIKHAK